jgi:hypothetical protein
MINYSYSTPYLVPERIPRTAYGACDMFSVPPQSTTSASPSRISCAPFITAWKPDPHNLLIVSAGAVIGTFAWCPTCLARYAASCC